MVTTTELLNLSQMELLAKQATNAALAGYSPPSEEQKESLTLGRVLTDTTGVFELYVPADRPENATVLSRATVDRATGSVSMEVFLKPIWRYNSPGTAPALILERVVKPSHQVESGCMKRDVKKT